VPATIMSDSLHFDISAHHRVRPSRRAGMGGRSTARAELPATEPINVYHWAAVALVTALMCAVLACAAGTPALSKAATITSMVFGALGTALVAAGLMNAARVRVLRREAPMEGVAS
jgi:hypothetical protein